MHTRRRESVAVQCMDRNCLNAETQDNADGRHVEGTSEHGRCVPSAYVDSGLAIVIAAWFNLNKSEQAQILATATR